MIIVGTDYRISAIVNIDLAEATATSFKVQPPCSNPQSIIAATVSGINLSANVTAAENIYTGEHRIWAEVTYSGGFVYRSGARTYTVYPEGSLQT